MVITEYSPTRAKRPAVFDVGTERYDGVLARRLLPLAVGAIGVGALITAGLQSSEASGLSQVQTEICAEAAAASGESGQTEPQLAAAGSSELERSLENIRNMNLTCKGFVQALANVNTDYYAYAQASPKFNPVEMARRGVPQQSTEFYTLHISANYYNADGSVTTGLVGETNVKLFIDSIDRKDDLKCCGINQFIDRKGQIYWLAPGSAKLRHNKGYDGLTTGKEMEGHLQKDLTPEQLAASAYLDIGNMYRDGLAGEPLEKILRGHAKTRAEHNIAQPRNREPAKIDWEEAPTVAYRNEVSAFLAANPNLKQLVPISFLELP